MSTVRFVADLLQRHAAQGAVVIDDDPEMLAIGFQASVRSFLDGVKPR